MTPPKITITTAYQPRRVGHLPNWVEEQHHFKRYTIAYDDTEVDLLAFEHGLAFAFQQLSKKPSFSNVQLGFIIEHQGNSADYLILGYWANENECFIEVFIHQFNTPKNAWRPAKEESFCIWDLQIIGFERQAYVRHILSQTGEVDCSAYLEARYTHNYV